MGQGGQGYTGQMDDETRLKLQLHIHEGDNQSSLENYWSEVTQIPKKRFTKTIIRPIGNKIGKTKGTCKIRYSDKETYLKLKNILRQTFKKYLCRLYGCGGR